MTLLITPHFPHLASIRVSPFLMAMDYFSIASRTSRSVSSRIACFDISLPLVLENDGALSSRIPDYLYCRGPLTKSSKPGVDCFSPV